MSTQLTTRPARRRGPDPSLLSDVALPAVRFLTGDAAVDVLRAPIEAAGGHLVRATPRNVQYRPGSDLVVKYTAMVEWPGRPAKRETLMAATGTGALPDGTVPVAALVDGSRVEVGVWRWPFDPVLVGLATAVTQAAAANLCQFGDTTTVSVEVLAFRPTERAVVRVAGPAATRYLKVVPPASAPALVGAHRTAHDAGVRVPRVRAAFDDLGIVVLDELPGPLLKEHVKAGTGVLPRPDAFDDLADRFARIEGDLPLAPGRMAHAVGHAAMLRTIDGVPADGLDRLGEAFAAFESDDAPQPIHGDLHEGQLVVDDGRISGVLDLDDLGVGSAIEERANLIGFLRFRAIVLPAHRARIDAYADRLRAASSRRHDLDRLDVATSAVLVGLATGPFRIQQAGWRTTVAAVIADAADGLPPARSSRAVSVSPTSPPTPEEP